MLFGNDKLDLKARVLLGEGTPRTIIIKELPERRFYKTAQ